MCLITACLIPLQLGHRWQGAQGAERGLTRVPPEVGLRGRLGQRDLARDSKSCLRGRLPSCITVSLSEITFKGKTVTQVNKPKEKSVFFEQTMPAPITGNLGFSVFHHRTQVQCFQAFVILSSIDDIDSRQWAETTYRCIANNGENNRTVQALVHSKHLS